MGSRLAGDPVLIAFRVGVILLLLALLSLVPARVAAWVAPLGKSSLAVYALHLPVVYGWYRYRGLSWWVGPRVGMWAGLGIAALVLLLSFVAWRAVALVARRLRAAWAGRS